MHNAASSKHNLTFPNVPLQQTTESKEEHLAKWDNLVESFATSHAFPKKVLADEAIRGATQEKTKREEKAKQDDIISGEVIETFGTPPPQSSK